MMMPQKLASANITYVIPAAKDSKSLAKYLREMFDGSDVPLQLL
jgi:hypothetical protein